MFTVRLASEDVSALPEGPLTSKFFARLKQPLRLGVQISSQQMARQNRSEVSGGIERSPRGGADVLAKRL